jgi:hypothetical protein
VKVDRSGAEPIVPGYTSGELYRSTKALSSTGEAIARVLRLSLSELLVQRRVALTAKRDGARAPVPEAFEETDEDREERDERVDTSDTIESGDEAEEVERAREDRRTAAG